MLRASATGSPHQPGRLDAYPSKVFLPAVFCVVQRFGSALQLAPHLHAVLFDGAYREDEAGKLHFVAAPALTPATMARCSSSCSL